MIWESTASEDINLTPQDMYHGATSELAEDTKNFSPLQYLLHLNLFILFDIGAILLIFLSANLANSSYCMSEDDRRKQTTGQRIIQTVLTDDKWKCKYVIIEWRNTMNLSTKLQCMKWLINIQSLSVACVKMLNIASCSDFVSQMARWQHWSDERSVVNGTNSKNMII